MSKVDVSVSQIHVGDLVDVSIKGGGSISGEVTGISHSSDWMEQTLEFAGGINVPIYLIASASIDNERFDRPGVFVYMSYGLDDDGHMTDFPNILLHTKAGEWYRIGNANAQSELIDGPPPSAVPLTIHPNFI